MCSAAEGGPSAARAAGPRDASDKAAVRIQVAVRTIPDTSCYDAKDHTTMAAGREADKAEGRWRCGNCAHACSITWRMARQQADVERQDIAALTESFIVFEHALAIDHSRSTIGAGRPR